MTNETAPSPDPAGPKRPAPAIPFTNGQLNALSDRRAPRHRRDADAQGLPRPQAARHGVVTVAKRALVEVPTEA